MAHEPGTCDELESEMTRRLRDPGFRRAYEESLRHYARLLAWYDRGARPGRLSIDGREYHRRQQARRRRHR